MEKEQTIETEQITFNGKAYMEDGQGRLVLVETIDPATLLKDDLVKRLVDQARGLQEILKTHKDEMLSEVASFVALSAEEYDVKYGGKKGNVTLTSYNGKMKIYKQVGDVIAFDEGLLIAKELIDKCLNEWTEGSNAHIKAVVENIFNLDKMGPVDTQRILGLRKLKIQNKDWQKAMDIIHKSARVVGSTEYIRAYYKPEVDGKTSKDWECITLDMAAV